MDYRVSDYGAVGDGVTFDTAAIQRALDDCAARGGGRVILESGCTYLSASLHLRPHTALHLNRGSRLLASPNLDDYFRPDQPGTGGSVSHVGTPVVGKPSYVFIYGYDAPDTAITGDGVIDGNAYAFVRRVSPWYVTGDFYPRPTLIYVEKCDHSSFTGVTLKGAPFWSLHMAGCEDVLVQSLRILNDLDIANSDGIDVDHSRNVRILGCHVECADDCICMKNLRGNREYPHTRDVIVSDCTLVSTSAAIKIGTEGVDDFENILVSRCIISRSNRGLSIQIRDGGNVRNISFTDIMIETRRFAESWWGCAEPIAITAIDRAPDNPGGSIRDVRFRNVTCVGENGAVLWGEPGRISNVTFEDVDIRLRRESRWPIDCYDLRPGASVSGLTSRKSLPIWAHGVDGLTLRHVRTQDFDGCTSNDANIDAAGCSNIRRED
ncbi:MAG: glycoside hydrolase family 28 protein [Clostridia bacterium]|nr:glycoside hydrolase family 28 protein [Clostridia bacterium]